MANDKRFIVKNGLRADNVEFTDSQDGSNQITLNMLNTDTLNFEGDAGSLFSISDDLTGSVFSVGDISGIPIIDVNGDTHNVTFNEFDGKVMIGGTDSGSTDSDVLNVTGNVRATGATITGVLTADGVDLGDSEELRIGTSQDLRLYHDGTNSYITHNNIVTSSLILQNINTDNNSTDGIRIETIDNTASGLDNYVHLPNNAGVVLGASGADKVSVIANGSYFNHDIILNSPSHELKFRDQSYFTILDAVISASQDHTVTLPDATGTIPVFTTAPTGAIADGTNGQVLTTNGSGTLSFADAGGGGLDSADVLTVSGLTSGFREYQGGTTFDPAGGGTGTDTATDVGVALTSGTRIVGTSNGYIRTLLDWNVSSVLDIGQAGTTLIQHVRIFGGTQGVELYENGSKRIETTSTGATVTGELVADSASITNIRGTLHGAIKSYNANSLNTFDITAEDNGGSTHADAIRLNPGAGHVAISRGGSTSTYDEYTGLFGLDVFGKDTYAAKFDPDGDQQLYHAGSQKFYTTSTGVLVVGTVNADSATIAGTVNATAFVGDGSGLTGLSSGGLDSAGVLTISGLLRSDVADTKTSGHLRFSDGVSARFGDSDDLQIYHSVGQSNIREAGSGDLNIWGDNIVFWNSQGNENKAKFITDGTVELYYDNSKKFETTSTGVTVTGLLSATTKSFDIEHPTEEGKRLRYGSLEGPENGVYVRGRLKGDNRIQLPDHWTGLVDEDTITVNLTPIGNQQSLFVEDIADNEVLIGGGRKHVDAWDINCFYTVYGERKDVDQLVVEYDA